MPGTDHSPGRAANVLSIEPSRYAPSTEPIFKKLLCVFLLIIKSMQLVMEMWNVCIEKGNNEKASPRVTLYEIAVLGQKQPSTSNYIWTNQINTLSYESYSPC